MRIQCSQALNAVIEGIIDAGGHPYFVGGCVRDALLGYPIKDYDIEIFGLSQDQLETILKSFGYCDFVGKSFGVYKLSHLPEADFALPRKEKKLSLGHQGFEIKVDPYLSLEKASIRRDFTMNAIYYDLKNHQLIDCHGGMEDLQAHRIKHVNAKTFVEDPLRVYRLAQFMSRFQFECHPNTKQLCMQVAGGKDIETLSKERIKQEYDKLLLGKQPSLGLQFLDDLGLLISEVSKLKQCHQREDYHPEGSAYHHTLMAIDAASTFKDKTSNPLAFMWGVLLHDIGKAKTTDSFGHAYGHEIEGSQMAEAVMTRLTHHKKQKRYIVYLVLYHMRLMGYVHSYIKDKTYLKFLKSISPAITLQDLYYMSKSDLLGTGRDASEDLNALDVWMDDYPKRLGDRAWEPCVTGKDLIELGFHPGPKIKAILDQAYDLQIGGMKKEGILKVLSKEVMYGK